MTSGFEFLVVFTSGCVAGIVGAFVLIGLALRHDRENRRRALRGAVVDIGAYRAAKRRAG